MGSRRETARIQDKNAGVPDSVGVNAQQSHTAFAIAIGVKSAELRRSIYQRVWRSMAEGDSARAWHKRER